MNEQTPFDDDDGSRGLVLPRLCAAISIALGLAVLIGWALDIAALKSVVPGLISMKANAALGFLMAGLALGAFPESKRGSRLVLVLAGCASSIGALTLFQYLSGVDLGIDQLLAEEPSGTFGALARGRMHPTTAFDLILLGLAMILIDRGRAFRTAHSLALVAGLIAGSALIGYAYGVRIFVGMAAYNQMALHTAAGMLVLSIGVLMLRPGRGFMMAITSDTEGGLMARRLIPVAILLPFTLDGLVLLSNWAHIFDPRFATAVRVIATIAIFVVCIGWNAQMLQRVDRERLRSDQAIRILADSLPQVVWTAQPDGRIDYWNVRRREFTGQEMTPGEPLEWRKAVHPDDVGPLSRSLAEALRTGEGYELEYRLRRASDGSYRWHLGRVQPMRDRDGTIVRWFGTATDIHDQKMAGEKRYRSLVEATTAIVWNTPASGEFESEQPGWSDFTGQDFDKLKGWGWLDAIHPEDRPETARVWSDAVASRSIYRVEHRLRRHDGEYRHMMVCAVPVVSEGGVLCEWVGVHTDNDLQKRAEEALREAKEAAEATTRAKGEFLANMSHEIRTPMNGILGMTELALGTDLTDRQREYLGLVKSSGEALLVVINDILDFSKIEAGKLELDPIPFAIREAVTDTLRTMAIRAHEKGLELVCRIAPDVPEWLVGDQGRLRQVLINLVGNAIKFTEQGEVYVSVYASASDVVDFAVTDTGIGIPAAKREAIFAPFEQADGSTTRKYGGTGLGLTISSRLVELMGGRIWVEENPGGGSVFRFNARFGADLECRDGPRKADPRRLTGLRVLVVDDNRTNRLILGELLTQWGCRVTSAVGGSEALVAIAEAVSRREPFEALLLDQMMPAMDGTELADRVRRDPELVGVKIVMLTSGGTEHSSWAHEVGIAAWLSKPIRPSELLKVLLSVLEPDATIQEEALPAAGEAKSKPSERSLRVLLAEDHPINQIVATRMLEDQGHEVTVVGDGRAAVEAAQSRSFDVILMDVQMPEMDGFEAVQIIRSREQGAGHRVPIVALTAHAMVGDRERCISSGFDEYLSKPIQASTLRAALGRLDSIARFSDKGDTVSPILEQAAFNRQEALENLGGDERLLDEVLDMFLRDCPRLMAELRVAMGTGDACTVGRIAHTLSGVAGNFAAPAIIAPARRLQAMGKSGELADAEAALVELGLAIDRFRDAVGGTPGGGLKVS